MRLNRGTLALIGLLVIIIIAVAVISNQQASAPAATATPQQATGPLLPGVAGETVVRYEVRDNTDGRFVALTKDAGGAWNIDATYALDGRDPEQSLINSTVGQLTNINYNNTFQDDQLATFGLDHPGYTILVTTSDSRFYTVYIGSKSPTSARYYAVVEEALTSDATEEATSEVASKRIIQAATEEATAEATSEATPEVTPEATREVISSPEVTLEGTQTIYLIPQTVIDTLTAWLANPPYAPLPTAEPTTDTTESLLPIPEIVPTVVPTEATPEATVEATVEATAEATTAS